LRHLVRALPPGVLNVVTGADEGVGSVVSATRGQARLLHRQRCRPGVWAEPRQAVTGT